jgi:hypothetical protein
MTKKGLGYTDLENVYKSLLFAAGIAGLILIVIGNVEISGAVKTAMDDIKKVEAAHSVAYCFVRLSGDKDYFITENFLDSNRDKEIKEVCGIEKPSIDAAVTDFGSGRKWGFADTDTLSDYDHMIFVSIEHADGTVSVGGLYVEI